MNTPSTPSTASTLHARRDCAESPAAVFDALSRPERLARWWGPDGFSNEVEQCDVVPGGDWVFTMIGPDGSRYPNRARFERVEPPHRLVIRHTVAPLFTLTLTLQPLPAGGTRVLFDQAFDDPAVAEALRPVCEPANHQNLARLAAELARTPG